MAIPEPTHDVGYLNVHRAADRNTIHVRPEHSQFIRRFFEHKGALFELQEHPGLGMDVLTFHHDAHDGDTLEEYLEEWKRGSVAGQI